MGTFLRSYGGYILFAIVAVLFIFPAAIPQELRFVLGITCVPAAFVFTLVKFCGDGP
jgi:hypothetical protein